MRKVFCAVFIFLAVSGCSINKQFVETCQDSWDTIGPEYVKYVNADTSISEETKKIRIRSATNFTNMLNEAAK